MLKSPVYHVTQVSDDLGAAKRCFERLFVPRPVVTGEYVSGRNAIFCEVADLLLEVMVPDDTGIVLQRFLSRIGPHLHSVAWYVDDIDMVASALRDRGIRLMDASGCAVSGKVPWPSTYEGTAPVFYTHPVDTFGMHEFKQAVEDPGKAPVPEVASGTTDGIVRGSHLTTVVQDRNAVADLWVDVFGARVVNEGENRARRTVSTYVRVGELPGTVLEFAEVRPDGPAALDLGLCPTGILHSITFLVRDIEVIRARLVGSGFDLEFDGDEMIVTDPSSTLGARFGFTTVELA